MDGLACSEHVLRVVPDPEKIPPGYLYAYLSSKFGVPLVVGGTYGAIIQHIEPEHVADLPVPRFGAAFEWQIHELVERAAVLRVLAARSLCEVASRFDQIISKVSLDHPSPRIASVPASSTQARLDAQYHDPVAEQVRAALHQGRHTTVGGWCSRVFLPGIFKRIHIDDPAYGAPYYTGATLFWLEPQAKGILSRRSTLFEAVSLRKGTILLQAFGQEGGLTGRSVWVGQHLDGATSTHMLVRLAASTEEDTAYLFGFLQSKTAYLQIAVLPYGGSIPHFDEAGVSGVVVPVLDTHERTQLSAQVLSAVNARDEALMADRRARALLEDAIAKGSS
jgi:type I restriction enzyme S subunit